MRFVYISLIVLATLAALTFKVQNIDTVTVSFLSASLSLPLSLLLLCVYLLGMLTGGSAIALLRSWARGAKLKDKPGHEGGHDRALR